MLAKSGAPLREVIAILQVIALALAAPKAGWHKVDANNREIKLMRIALALTPLALLALSPALAGHHEEGEVVVTSEMELPADATWKHSFDAYESAAGKPNAAFRRALAFHRAMEAEGVAADAVKTAIVVHGPAVFDVVNDARYAKKHGIDNPEGMRNQAHNDVAELVSRGAEIWVCGVAAKYHKVGNADLLDGVKMAPSGTVAHADLQRRGFGLNAY